jgi:hypothetical protein
MEETSMTAPLCESGLWKGRTRTFHTCTRLAGHAGDHSDGTEHWPNVSITVTAAAPAQSDTPASDGWTCEHRRSHGRCNGRNGPEDETCGACGEDRPGAADVFPMDEEA